MIRFAFRQGLPQGGALVQWAFAAHAGVSGNLLGLSFASSGRYSGQLLAWGFGSLRMPLRFSGALGIGSYELVLCIDGRNVDVCRLLRRITVSHAENRSYLCDLTLREDAGAVNVYLWHGKAVTLDAVHEGGRVRLFTGIADVSGFDLRRRLRTVSCSDRRERLINGLPESVVRRVGFTSEAVHGVFKDLAQEMERRLETVPASFEFDAGGTGYLTPWKPKAVADRVIGNCDVYVREPSVEVMPVGRVVNRVNLHFGRQFTRLLQRDVSFDFQSGYTVCDFGWWGLPPEVSAIRSAVEAAGWAVGRFESVGLPPAGWYHCNGSRMMWSPVSRRLTAVKNKQDASGRDYTDEKGNPIRDRHTVQSRDYTDVYAVSAQWTASKRWRQPVDHVYELTLQNSPSIRRYGELAEEMVFNIRHESESEWGRGYAVAEPVPKGYLKLANGDFYTDLNEKDDFEAALRCSWHMAYTKMLASHRENVLRLQIKFLPELDLRHTHRVEHRNFTGNVKVAGFTHDFNIAAHRGTTEVEYKFYQNLEDGALSGFVIPPPPDMPPLPPPVRNTRLGTVVLPQGADREVSKLNGFVVQIAAPAQTVLGRRLPERRNRVAFAVSTQDIEQVLTDTLEIRRIRMDEVGIPDDRVDIVLG